MIKYELPFDLDIAEEIINYHYNFYGNYLNNKKIMNFIKDNKSKDRMFYVLNCCDLNNPSKREQFIIALAYNLLSKEYNNYAIKYLKMYLADNKYYIKNFKPEMEPVDSISYQWLIFYKALAIKYDDNLEYDKALKYIDMALHIDFSMCKEYEEPYLMYAQISYHLNDYTNIKKILTRGIKETKSNYNKQKYSEELKRYLLLEKNNKIYKPNNTIRKRIDVNTGSIYNLTTGEIIK